MSAPPPQRTLSTHTPSGSTWRSTSAVQLNPVDPAGTFKLGTVLVQPSFDVDPLSMPEWQKDGAQGTVRKEGVVCRIAELAVGASSPMHYTNAIEYTAVLSGEMEVHGADGVKSRLKQGEVFVVGADVHQIVNVGDVPLRAFIVAVASKPVLIDGKELSEAQGALDLTHYIE